MRFTVSELCFGVLVVNLIPFPLENDFRINKILELNFEFRTSEQNGILLSISSVDNSPALSIELQAGAVVMTVDNGYGYLTNVMKLTRNYKFLNYCFNR